MVDESDNPLRKQIDELVNRLPAGLVHALLSEIESMDDEPSDRVRLVRHYVIEFLNRQRTNRARRLFTNLFEPFLIDDDALYHADAAAPAMVQRVDVGALWDVVSRDAFPLLAVQAQETLDRMARTELLERALRSEAALALRERMRVAARRHLERVAADRKLMEAMLADMARNRPRRSKLLSANLNRALPVEAATAHTFLAVLALPNDELGAVIEGLDAVPPESDGIDARDRDAEALYDAMVALVERAPERRPGPSAALLLGLSVLNVRRNYPVVAHVIRMLGDRPNLHEGLSDGLIAHVKAVSRACTVLLSGALRVADRAPGAPVRPSAREKSRIEALMARLEALCEAVEDSGLLEERRPGAVLREAREAAARVVTTRIAAVALERAAAAAASRRGPEVDHADAVWLVRTVWLWRRQWRPDGPEGRELAKWRDTVLDELRANTERVLKFGEEESLDERMAHLMRIDALCQAFNRRVSDWIGTSSQSMARLIGHRLRGAAAIGDDERAVIDRILRAVRSDVQATRAWKSDELVTLLELSDAKRAASATPG